MPVGNKQALDLQEDGDYSACGDAFLDLQADNPDYARGDELLYNAGICLDQARRTRDAIAAFEKLRRVYPGSRLAGAAAKRIAELSQLP